MSTWDPESVRSEIRARWERVAGGWGRQAERVREWGMPVSTWMIEHAQLQEGQRVLELAAGPGDTGFLAAELIRPGGTLICSDATGEMLDVARARAAERGVDNVEFKQLELEWIDLPTASVDAALCRWGLMFSVDPEAALREARRVLRPGGRIALAVWDEPSVNPWATITTRALVELGHIARPDPDVPGNMFVLARPRAVQELLEAAGFVDVLVEAVELERSFAGVADYVLETRELSAAFSQALDALPDDQAAEVVRRVAELAQAYTAADGALTLPGRSLVAAGDA